MVAALPGEAGGLEGLVLVGESGQIYLPSGGNTWRRQWPGGIADDVQGAVRDASGATWLVGRRAPLYVYRAGAWQVHGLSVRGGTLYGGPGSVPAVAIRRWIFAFDGERWQRITRSRGKVRALWASSESRIYVIDDAGQISRSDGKRWTPIGHTLPEGDVPEKLMGISGRALYAVSQAGTLLSVGTSTSAEIPAPSELAGLQVLAACSDGSDGIYLIAALGSHYVLAQLARDTLSLVEQLPAPPEGDHYSLCVARRDGQLLLSTYDGMVRLRSTSGSWAQGSVQVELPGRPALQKRGPARTR